MTQDLTTWAEQLIGTLESHMDSERRALTQYGQLADSSPNDHVRFLMKLILEDEVRHHGFFADMVNYLRAEMEQTRNGALPELRRAEDRRALVAKTKELLELERDDIKDLHDLRKKINKVADVSWWSVILEAMEMDNRKHVRLLEFIRDNA